LLSLPFAGIIALSSPVVPPGAPAQQGNFEIAQHGRTVGTASFNFAATPEGYDSTSLVKV